MGGGVGWGGLQGAFHCHFLFFSTQTSEEEEHKEFSVKEPTGWFLEAPEQKFSFHHFQRGVSLMFRF